MSNEDNLKPEELERRKQWFHWYVDQLDNNSVRTQHTEGEAFRCPCCDYKTLGERGGYEICPVCFWEDDGQDDHDADAIRGGPNGAISLTQARANYKKIGASLERHIKHIRPPKPEEM
jgi:hypothetical protein